MGIFGVDYSQGYTIPDLKSNGVRFACRYLAYPTGGAPYAKFISLAEARDLISNGIAIVSNWEQAGNPENENGIYAATTAAASHAALGAPASRPIYFSYDRNGPLGSGGIQYYRDCCSILGVSRVGAYGPPDVLAQLKSLGLISWLWSWSPMPAAHIVQQGTHRMGSIIVDYDTAQALDFGQWGVQSFSNIYSGSTPFFQYESIPASVHQLVNNVPGFSGIFEAMDLMLQFQPLVLPNSDSADALLAPALETITGGLYDKVVKPISVPLDNLQAVLTFIVSNAGAFIFRSLIVTVGMILLFGLLLNISDLESKAKQVAEIVPLFM